MEIELWPDGEIKAATAETHYVYPNGTIEIEVNTAHCLPRHLVVASTSPIQEPKPRSLIQRLFRR